MLRGFLRRHVSRIVGKSLFTPPRVSSFFLILWHSCGLRPRKRRILYHSRDERRSSGESEKRNEIGIREKVVAGGGQERTGAEESLFN